MCVLHVTTSVANATQPQGLSARHQRVPLARRGPCHSLPPTRPPPTGRTCGGAGPPQGHPPAGGQAGGAGPRAGRAVAAPAAAAAAGAAAAAAARGWVDPGGQ